MSDSESDSPPPPTAPVPVEHAASRPDEQADHHQHHHHHHRSSSGRTSHRSHRHEKHDHDGGDHGDADDADDDDDRDDDPTTASTSKHHKHASSGKGAHKQHSGRDGKHKHKHSVENNDDADADDDDPDADLGKHFGEYDITAANDDDAWPAEAASTAATYGYAIASYKCESEEDSKDQIDFTKGDKLKLYERDGKSGWWRADLHHKRGFILSGYVSVYFIDPWRYEADYGVRLPRLEDSQRGRAQEALLGGARAHRGQDDDVQARRQRVGRHRVVCRCQQRYCLVERCQRVDDGRRCLGRSERLGWWRCGGSVVEWRRQCRRSQLTRKRRSGSAAGGGKANVQLVVNKAKMGGERSQTRKSKKGKKQKPKHRER
jgi:hypothetical protein